jgi:hypothetical protein
MFDRDRLFRVLFHLSRETNDFLLAQDAYETVRSCISQIKDAHLIISEMEERVKDCVGEDYSEQRRQLTSYIEKLHEVQFYCPLWCSFLSPLLDEALEFWFCCPVDHTRCVGENKSPMDKWRHFKENDIASDISHRISQFKSHCASLVGTHFSDLLSLLQQEIDQEQNDQNILFSSSNYLLNNLPLVYRTEFSEKCNQLIATLKFPRTHFHSINDHFIHLIGYSTARLLGVPVAEYIYNIIEKTSMNKQIDDATKTLPRPTMMRLFYRTSTGQLVGVLWMLGSNLIDECFCGLGVDITQEIETSRLKQAVSIQKMLKQWLHSIRNASFEQQARVILEDVHNLEKKVNRSDVRAEFESITECVKLLMHTARTSVGLIDQALETRGLTQHMCVSDFVSNITSFPHHFAQSEGIPAIYTRYRFLLNGNPASPQDYASFFVTGDIISLQSIVDNIISNAVRWVEESIFSFFVSIDLSFQVYRSRSWDCG